MKYNNRNVKLYSRKKFNLFSKATNDRYYINDNIYNKRIIYYKIMVVIIIATITAMFLIININPFIDEIAVNEVQNKVKKISNDEIGQIMQYYSYDDLITIKYDDNNNIAMIQANTGTINSISADISKNVLEKLRENSNSNIKIYIGSILGTTLFSGMGPSIKTKILSTGNVNINLKSEFYSAGINQTLHRIYFDVSLNLSILTPYHSISRTTSDQILVAESIIVGNVPDAYYFLHNGEITDIID